jgi:hypothetical protein
MFFMVNKEIEDRYIGFGFVSCAMAMDNPQNL